MSSVAGQRVGMSHPSSSSRPPSRASSLASSHPPPSSSRDILTPANNAVLNRSHTQDSLGSAPGKRKRDGIALAADSLLKAPIVLKPHPSGLTVKPRMLHPLMLLPREHLPLSALDLSQPHGDLPASRLFESRIKILDLEGRMGFSVLLARSEADRTVYAVEQENNGLYVLCKLGAWVDVARLAENATVVCKERMKDTKPAKPSNETPVPLTTPALYKESKRRRLAIEELQSLVRRRSRSTTEEPRSEAPVAPDVRPASSASNTGPVNTPHGDSRALAQSCSATPNGKEDSPAGMPGDEPPARPDTGDIFTNIRTQYAEALYHSKGSLAYFAKGPLSRARAAFQNADSNLQMNDLVDFLKSLIITTVMIDKKYRETIPEIVAKVKTLGEESDKAAPSRKKKKTKKPRLGKDGLYPGEIQHVKRWAAAHQPVSSGDDEITTTAAETKYHISCLRRRETQLQMIIILEILALEPLAQPKPAPEESQLQGVESQAPSREASQEPSSKKRNKHNLPVLLDIHADRLCIWQSTTLDEVRALAESRVLAGDANAGKPQTASSADPLRDFCVDIIIPFFSARLPGPCDTLNRKLGGPVAQSPPKAKNPKPASVVKPKPGAPIKRARISKKDKDKALERALSVERSRRSVSRGPADAISLLRSASNTVIPGLKREASDPSLRRIPRADTGSIKDNPLKLFSRSVSLSETDDRRAKKKADVEAELRDAISTLKRPNRALAVKEFVEAAEKRASVGQLKKLKKPNRASAVQVKATPANNRFRDALAPNNNHHSQPALPSFDFPPSSASVVPSSTLPRKFADRLPGARGGDATTTTNVRPDFAIQDTPVRATAVPTNGTRAGAGAGGAAAAARSRPESPGGVSPILARKSAPSATATAATARASRVEGVGGGGGGSRPLSVPCQGGGDDNLLVPSSPGLAGLAGLFETPLAPRAKSLAAGAGFVVEESPIPSRLLFPVSGNNGGGGSGSNNSSGGKAKGSGRGSGRGSGIDSGLRSGKENGGRALVSDEENGAEVMKKTEQQPSREHGQERAQEISIYQRLGWDLTDFDDI
ncbi:hypothetical protein VTK26DRAFT_5568 [Humicola hyalothermophila]